MLLPVLVHTETGGTHEESGTDAPKTSGHVESQVTADAGAAARQPRTAETGDSSTAKRSHGYHTRAAASSNAR
jgi:hypothetical protein